jgi:hypothetical protein
MIGGPPSCDFPGCTAVRREVNFWYVVTQNACGVHIYKWETCPPEAMQTGNHYCGLSHAFRAASKALTPDETDPNRKSTLELQPIVNKSPAALHQVAQDEPAARKEPIDPPNPESATQSPADEMLRGYGV